VKGGSKFFWPCVPHAKGPPTRIKKSPKKKGVKKRAVKPLRGKKTKFKQKGPPHTQATLTSFGVKKKKKKKRVRKKKVRTPESTFLFWVPHTQTCFHKPPKKKGGGAKKNWEYNGWPPKPGFLVFVKKNKKCS